MGVRVLSRRSTRWRWNSRLQASSCQHQIMPRASHEWVGAWRPGRAIPAARPVVSGGGSSKTLNFTPDQWKVLNRFSAVQGRRLDPFFFLNFFELFSLRFYKNTEKLRQTTKVNNRCVENQWRWPWMGTSASSSEQQQRINRVQQALQQHSQLPKTLPLLLPPSLINRPLSLYHVCRVLHVASSAGLESSDL